jgi:hypothetical protein
MRYQCSDVSILNLGGLTIIEILDECWLTSKRIPKAWVAGAIPAVGTAKRCISQTNRGQRFNRKYCNFGTCLRELNQKSQERFSKFRD